MGMVILSREDGVMQLLCNATVPVASYHSLVCSSQFAVRSVYARCFCEHVNMHVCNKHTSISVVHEIAADLLKAFSTSICHAVPRHTRKMQFLLSL